MQEKTRQTFFAEISTVVFHSRTQLACGKRVRHRVQQGPFPCTERRVVTPTAPLPASRRTARADSLRRVGQLSYPSRVCSIMGGAIDDAVVRIAEAIDQLASDAQGDCDPSQIAARVAELWLMVSALDPELARRKQRYTTPADGTPST